MLAHLKTQGQLVDVRSPEEYAGTRLHMPDYPNEGAVRGGHIPGAKSVPWARAINPDDGTFKTSAELKKLYLEDQKLSPDKETIAYCRIGERSSHTWFALKYLLGFSNDPQLRRQLDGVGQPGERADRKRARALSRIRATEQKTSVRQISERKMTEHTRNLIH